MVYTINIGKQAKKVQRRQCTEDPIGYDDKKNVK
jgi:hypothetical protein